MIDQFLQNKSHIIINTDLDGIFSGLLLQKYSHLSVAGLCNSRDSIWLRDDVDSNDCVIVDMYVPSMTCIDQHIISIDQPHGASLLASGKTLNPNLFRDRYFIDPLSYRTKFPFSTTMYLVSLLDVDTQWFDDGGRAHGASSRDLFFRADDVLKICIDSPYTKKRFGLVAVARVPRTKSSRSAVDSINDTRNWFRRSGRHSSSNRNVFDGNGMQSPRWIYNGRDLGKPN